MHLSVCMLCFVCGSAASSVCHILLFIFMCILLVLFYCFLFLCRLISRLFSTVCSFFFAALIVTEMPVSCTCHFYAFFFPSCFLACAGRLCVAVLHLLHMPVWRFMRLLPVLLAVCRSDTEKDILHVLVTLTALHLGFFLVVYLLTACRAEPDCLSCMLR